MAFPVIQATSTYTTSGFTSLSSHPVPLPAGVQAGDVLIMLPASPPSPAPPGLITPPPGWDIVLRRNNNNTNIAVFKRLADGTEGATATFTMPNLSRATAIVYRISGADYLKIEAAGVGPNTIDPPNIVATWGADDNLFIPLINMSQSNRLATAAPANYGSLITARQASSQTGSDWNSMASAHRILAAASDDPGAFTVTPNFTLAQAAVAVIGPSPPLSITTQPTDQSVFEGQNVAFTVVAAGTEPLVYQWKRAENNSNISGANSASYIFTPTLADNGRQFFCFITDADNNEVTSATATLTVNPAMSIVTQPQDVFVELQGIAEFSVVVQDADSPPTYTWYVIFEGEVINTGETSATISVSPVLAQDYETQFYVVIDDGITELTSRIARILVSVPKTYGLAVDRQRGPIFHRGRVVLDSPITAQDGVGLLVRRKTPITLEYVASPLEPFKPEQFEHQIDRFTMILQEIEGDACACPPTEYPIPTGIDPGAYVDFDGEIPLECFPYSCSAVDQALTQSEMLQMRLYSLDAVLANHVDPFAGSAFDGNFFDDGSSVGWNSGGNVASSVLAGSGVLTDPCEGQIERVFRWSSRNVSTRTAAIFPRNLATVNTFVLTINPASLTADAGDSGILIRTARNYLVTRPAAGDTSFRPAAVIAFRVQSGVLQVQATPDTSGWVSLGTIGSGVLSNGEGVLAVSLLIGNPGFVYQDNSPFTNRYVFTAAISGFVTINTGEDSATYSFDLGQYETSEGYFDSGEGPPTFTLQPNISTTNTYFMSGAKFDAWSFGGKDAATPIDVTDFVLAMTRNRSDYEPPAWCPKP